MTKKELMQALEQLKDDEEVWIRNSPYGTIENIKYCYVGEYANNDSKFLEICTYENKR
jgi:phage anti-repressor protein